jgi:hypothetical protein
VLLDIINKNISQIFFLSNLKIFFSHSEIKKKYNKRERETLSIQQHGKGRRKSRRRRALAEWKHHRKGNSFEIRRHSIGLAPGHPAHVGHRARVRADLTHRTESRDGRCLGVAPSHSTRCSHRESVGTRIKSQAKCREGRSRDRGEVMKLISTLRIKPSNVEAFHNKNSQGLMARERERKKKWEPTTTKNTHGLVIALTLKGSTP